MTAIRYKFNPATWNPPAPARGGMRYNSREVALSSASRDNSTKEYYFTMLVIFDSHYYRELPAPTEGGSTLVLPYKITPL